MQNLGPGSGPGPGPNPKGSSNQSSRLARGGSIALYALLLSTVVAQSLDPDSFNHDVAWFLHGSEVVLDGGRLYVDLIDENPPLIFWLGLPAVALARLAHVPIVLVFNLGCAAVIWLCCVLCRRILKSAWPEAPASSRVALIGVLASVMVLLPEYDFGQRDHLMLIAVIPYLFAAGARAASRALSPQLAVAVGVVAGLGISLKPYFLIVWIAVEAWLLLKGRDHWRRPETLSIVAVITVFLLAVAAFASDYVDMLRIAAQVLDAYGSFGQMASLDASVVLGVAIAALVVALVRGSSLDRTLRHVLIVASFAFLASALLQGKGWSYHYYPAAAAALLAMGVVVVGFASDPQTLRGKLRTAAAGLPLLVILGLNAWGAMALGVAGSAAAGLSGNLRPGVARLSQVVEEHAKGGSFWLMSTSIRPSFPVVNLTGAHWSSRFCCLWLLPGLYTEQERATRPFPYHARSEMNEIERYLVDAVMEDLEAAPPDLLIENRSPFKQALEGTAFQFLAYFRRDPRFNEFFRQYRYLLDIGAMRVYKRRAAAD